MDLLIFERKRRTVKNSTTPTSVPIGKYYGILEGEQVIVSDPKASNDLNTFGCYGEFLQRREPRVSVECFGNNVHQQHQQERCHFKILFADSGYNGLNYIYLTIRKFNNAIFPDSDLFLSSCIQ